MSSNVLGAAEQWVMERRHEAPAKWKRIDAGESPRGAITEFCRSCMQTHRNVEDCPDRTCPLFPYRPGADRPTANRRVAGDVPTPEEYDQMVLENSRPNQGAGLKAWRDAQQADVGSSDDEE